MSQNDKEKYLGSVTFKKGNNILFGQAFRACRNIPSGVKFKAYEFNGNQIKLIADGYGNLEEPDKYGNGAIYVHRAHYRKLTD